MIPVTVIGMGLSPADLTAVHLEIIRSADLLVGGARHLAHFSDLPAETLEIKGRLTAVIEAIRDAVATRRVVVLASGDPLFYGIGALLIRSLGLDRVRVYPNITSVAAAFARIGEPWGTARVVSLHGREGEGSIHQALTESETVAVLTDPKWTPARLAGRLMDGGHPDLSMAVLEQLGAPEERVRWMSPAEAAAGTFAEPNLVILKRPAEVRPVPPVHPGMPESAFAHQRGLITKAEVRAVTLAKLRLDADDLTLWDLGAGSGAVSVEAARLLRRGRIIAVEKDSDRRGDIDANRRRYGMTRIEIVDARLPDGMADLPQPDRVFVGGGGSDLRAIIETAADRLRPGGILVMNTVLLASLSTGLKTLADRGWTPEVVQVQISRSRPMPHDLRLVAHNPVFILSGTKPGGATSPAP